VTARASLAIVTAVLALAVLRLRAQDAPQNQPPQFRANTDVVLVDVSVRESGRPVTGLRVDDFVLSDNGVRQRIESVEATAVPIDLTIVVDVSGNVRSPWNAPKKMAKVLEDVQAEITRIAALLRADDRLRVLAVDRNVQHVVPLTTVLSVAPVRRIDFDGLSALYDTLAAALMQPVEPARRHVVIASTKGQDNISSIGADAIRAIAERSDALLHVVAMETALDNDDALGAFQCQWMGYCWPTRRFWVPFQRRLYGPRPTHTLSRDGTSLAEAAAATGGAWHQTMTFSEPTLAGTFKKVFEDFRSSYVLRYSPRGVRREGWHAIDVRVNGSRRYTVAARKGYGIDETVPVPAVPPIPSVPRTLQEITSAYGRGGYQQTVDAIRHSKDPSQLLRELEDAGNPWPANPHREASLVLELAEPGIFASREAPRQQSYTILERFTRLVRHPLEPDVFERYWHFALLTMLEGSIQPARTLRFVERALERFPDEPRFVLSRAIVMDQSAAAVGRRDARDRGERSSGEAVRRAYEQAVALPETSVEARLRLAALLQRNGDNEEALGQLSAAAARPITDPYLQYLHLLFTGRTLDALNRGREAISAYRRALDVVPGAQSARVALMNALLVSGDRSGAEAVAEDVQTAGEQADPWWMYWQGQYRFHGQAMARVRELSR
jgi:VWFA-related protein